MRVCKLNSSQILLTREMVKIEAQRGLMICPRSHSKEMPKFEALVCFSDSKARLLLVI